MDGLFWATGLLVWVVGAGVGLWFGIVGCVHVLRNGREAS